MKNFSEFINGLRNSQNEVLATMSSRLGISIAYLSQIENNKRNYTRKLIQKVREEYGSVLSTEDLYLLDQFESALVNDVSINLINASVSKKQTAMKFKKLFDSANDEDIEQLSEFLKNKRGEE